LRGGLVIPVAGRVGFRHHGHRALAADVVDVRHLEPAVGDGKRGAALNQL
jgi:hypothetical protein